MKPFRFLPTFVALIAHPWCVAAHAQVFVIESISTTDTGRLVSAASGTTVLRASADSGNVTVASGNGVIVGSAAGRALVTLRCRESKLCLTNQPLIVINASGTPGGRADKLSNFSVSTSGATASIPAPPAPASAIEFLLEPIGIDTSKSFWVGFDLPIHGDDSGSPSCRATSAFMVTISPEDGSGSSALDGSVTANVLRGLSLAKTANLAFGRIVRPNMGSGLVRLESKERFCRGRRFGNICLGRQ